MAKPARRALGRGLTNLIPVEKEEGGSENEIFFVDINAITPNPFQPRSAIDEEKIRELAESIQSQGLLQPVTLRKKGNGYEIISGERRFRALKFLGHDKIPSIVKQQVTDRQMLELALVENIQREQLNDLEEAVTYQRLLVECQLSHEELSLRMGKSRSVISNTLRLLKLVDEVQTMLRSGQISSGHARTLLAIEDGQGQINLARRIVAEKLSVRDVEQIVSGQKGEGNRRKPAQPRAGLEQHTDPDMVSLLEKLQYKFGTPVQLKYSAAQKGKLEINFFSIDDLNRIIAIINP